MNTSPDRFSRSMQPLDNRASNLRAFTLVELLVAGGIFILLLGTVITLYVQGRKEAEEAPEVLFASQEARLAMKRISNELREAVRLVLPDDDVNFETDTKKYIYKISDPSSGERYGPSSNTIVFENFDGNIITYYFWVDSEKRGEEGGNLIGQIRQANLTERINNPQGETRYDVVARNIVVEQEESSILPSIFTVAKYFPGKQPSSVRIQLDVLEKKSEDSDTADRCYSLVTNVFFRNLACPEEEF